MSENYDILVNCTDQLPSPDVFHRTAYIASPYAGDTEKNITNARKYSKLAVCNGYIPIAPHLLFPQFLNDNNSNERELGLVFALALLAKADELWVFGKHRSEGMKREIEHAEKLGIPIKFWSE